MCELSDEFDANDIDSISVIAENRRGSKSSTDVSVAAGDCHGLGSSTDSNLVSSKPLSVGRGRGYILQLATKEREKLEALRIENRRHEEESQFKDYEDGNTFSFICEANIRGEEPFKTVTIASNSENVALAKVRLEDPNFGDQLKKRTGRGRGYFMNL